MNFDHLQPHYKSAMNIVERGKKSWLENHKLKTGDAQNKVNAFLLALGNTVIFAAQCAKHDEEDKLFSKTFFEWLDKFKMELGNNDVDKC